LVSLPLLKLMQPESWSFVPEKLSKRYPLSSGPRLSDFPGWKWTKNLNFGAGGSRGTRKRSILLCTKLAVYEAVGRRNFGLTPRSFARVIMGDGVALAVVAIAEFDGRRRFGRCEMVPRSDSTFRRPHGLYFEDLFGPPPARRCGIGIVVACFLAGARAGKRGADLHRLVGFWAGTNSAIAFYEEIGRQTRRGLAYFSASPVRGWKEHCRFDEVVSRLVIAERTNGVIGPARAKFALRLAEYMRPLPRA